MKNIKIVEVYMANNANKKQWPETKIQAKH